MIAAFVRWYRSFNATWWFVALIWALVMAFGLVAVNFYQTQGFTIRDVFETWSYIGSLLVAGSAVFAVLTYLYQKRKDKTEAVIDLLEIMREKIILRMSEVQQEIFSVHKLRKMEEMLSARIEVFDLDMFRRAHPEVAEQQARFFFGPGSDKYSVQLNDLANLLEEFALRVENLNAEDVPAMNSIMPLFVRAVESIAIYIMVESLSPGNGTFPGIRRVYNKWKDAPCISRSASFENRNRAIGELLQPHS